MDSRDRHEEYMALALELAREAAACGEVPVGCVIAGAGGRVIGRGRNRRRELADATAHAEMEAIRQACAALGDWRLTGCTMYVTLEPLPHVRRGHNQLPHTQPGLWGTGARKRLLRQRHRPILGELRPQAGNFCRGHGGGLRRPAPGFLQGQAGLKASPAAPFSHKKIPQAAGPRNFFICLFIPLCCRRG